MRERAAHLVASVDRPAVDLGSIGGNRTCASDGRACRRGAVTGRRRPLPVRHPDRHRILAPLEATSAPVLVWAVRDRETYGAGYRAVDAVAGAGPVGAGTPHHVALTNGLHDAVAAQLAKIQPIEHVAIFDAAVA